MEIHNLHTCKIQSRSLLVTHGETHYSFDRTGRFLFLTQPGRAVRRGLNDRMVESLHHLAHTEERKYRDLSKAEKEVLLTEAYNAVRACLAVAVESELPWLARILEWETRGLASDAPLFRNTYLPISILPPDQYHSLVVQVTEGCSYNRCLFCDFYRDRPFRIKSPAELLLHSQNIRSFFGERLSDRHEIFLGDGNALVIPTARLLTMLQTIRAEFGEKISTISTFVDTFTLDKKSHLDLVAIRQAGLHTAYIGFETGLDALRETLKKPGTATEAIEAIRLLKEAGWRVAVILLVNIGSPELAQRHFKATLESLATVPFTARDIVYLSPFVEPSNAPYLTAASELRADLVPLGGVDPHTEFLSWKKEIQNMHPGVKVSLYPIRQHLY